jgi:hypothetical protein
MQGLTAFRLAAGAAADELVSGAVAEPAQRHRAGARRNRSPPAVWTAEQATLMMSLFGEAGCSARAAVEDGHRPIKPGPHGTPREVPDSRSPAKSC